MKLGNRLGCVALVLFAVAALISFGQYESPVLLLTSVVGQWVGFGLFVFAGFKGSRWWFAVPVVVVFLSFWAFTRGH